MGQGTADIATAATTKTTGDSGMTTRKLQTTMLPPQGATTQTTTPTSREKAEIFSGTQPNIISGKII